MKIRAACYCRVSTHKEEQLESLEKQQEFFQRFFENNPEYELVRLYTDEGISAKSLRNRRQFQAMLRDAKAGRFDIIFVKDVSRFARNVQDFFNSLAMLEQCGVRIHFITLNLKTEEASRFTLGLMALLAEDESQRLSEKVKFGKHVTAKQGRVPNFVFGYDRVDNYTLTPNPEEAAWVRRIFSLYVQQGMGTARIAQLLNESGVATKRGQIGAWTQAGVSHILRNALYVGQVVNRKSEVINFRTGNRKQMDPADWVVVEKPEFRIVEEAIFQKAGEMLSQRSISFTRSARRESTRYALSNLLYCGSDGAIFRRCCRARAGGDESVWWACSVRNAKGVKHCNNMTAVPEQTLHHMITAFFYAQLLPEDAARAAALAVEKGAGGQGGDTSEILRREKRQLEGKRRRYMQLYADGLTGRSEVERALGGVNLRLKEIEKCMCVHRHSFNNRIELETKAKLLIEGLSGDAPVPSDHWALDNLLVKAVFDRLVVQADGSIVAHLHRPAAKPVQILFGARLLVPNCLNHTQGCCGTPGAHQPVAGE